MIYLELQHNHCMSNRGNSYFCTVNSNTIDNNRACISTDLANLICDEVENSQIPNIETLKQ